MKLKINRKGTTLEDQLLIDKKRMAELLKPLAKNLTLWEHQRMNTSELALWAVNEGKNSREVIYLMTLIGTRLGRKLSNVPEIKLFDVFTIFAALLTLKAGLLQTNPVIGLVLLLYISVALYKTVSFFI